MQRNEKLTHKQFSLELSLLVLQCLSWVRGEFRVCKDVFGETLRKESRHEVSCLPMPIEYAEEEGRGRCMLSHDQAVLIPLSGVVRSKPLARNACICLNNMFSWLCLALIAPAVLCQRGHALDKFVIADHRKAAARTPQAFPRSLLSNTITASPTCGSTRACDGCHAVRERDR